MIETTIEEIKRLAREYATKREKWHFHILTPSCQLNKKHKYALILENVENDIAHVCYSAQPYMNIGKELVQLLHGSDVIKKESEKKDIPVTFQISKLLERAKN